MCTKLMTKIKVLAVLLVLAFALTGCGSEKEEIKATVSSFERACQQTDLDGMLGCLDPSWAKPLQIAINWSGVDPQECIDEAVKTLFGSDFDSSSLLSDFSIEPGKIKAKKDSATVECKISFSVVGQTITKESVFSMKKKDEMWYIAGINFR